MRGALFRDLLDHVGKTLDWIDIAAATSSHSKGDTYGGSVTVASLAIGPVLGSACTGAAAAVTGGSGVAAAGGRFALGAGASYGFERLASRKK